MTGAHESQGFPSDTWRGRPQSDLIKRAHAGIDRRHFDIAETFQIESRPFGIVDTAKAPTWMKYSGETMDAGCRRSLDS